MSRKTRILISCGEPSGDLYGADLVRHLRPSVPDLEIFGLGRQEHPPALPVALATIEKLIREHFDLRPAAILRDLDLRRPIYRKTAAYGHFGRNDHDFTWERTDKADLLREAAGLTAAKASR